ncbi:MAG: hypothetical protein ACYSR5_11290 [Planctomycetota bacterium]|jgi:hypothetical protein
MKKGNGKSEPLTVHLNQSHLRMQVANDYDRQIDDGVTDEDLLDPKALGPSWRNLHPKDIVYLQNSKFLWVLRVRSVAPGLVQTVLLNKYKLPPLIQQTQDKDAVPGFRIYLDENDGWKAVREKDGVTMASQKRTPTLNSFEAIRREVLDHATLRR